MIKEIAEQVATRLRNHGCQPGCVSLMVGYSMYENERGFSRQVKVPFTNSTKDVVRHCLFLFDKFYRGQSVRNLGVSCSKLKVDSTMQLDLFKEVENQVNEQKLDEIVDTVRAKYGFASLVHASSLTSGATAIKRNTTLIGGHASGRDEKDVKQIQ